MAKTLKNGQSVEVLATSKGITAKGVVFDIADPSQVTITSRSPRVVRKQQVLWAKIEGALALEVGVDRAYVLLETCNVQNPDPPTV